MKKLFIFDFDGTLFNSIDDVIISFDKTLKTHNFPTLTREDYIESVGGNIDEIITAILKNNATYENIELVKNTYEKIYDSSEKELTIPYKGINETLSLLAEKNILLAINSNRKTNSIKYFVNRNLEDIDFAYIEGHDINHPSKPNPYGVNKILNELNVLPCQTIYVGDSITDILTAKNAGIDCVIVKWGYSDEKAYTDEYPLKIINNPKELLDII